MTSFDPPAAWVFDGCYIRFSGEDYDSDDLNDFIHLTNHSVQATKLKKNRCSFENLLEDQETNLLCDLDTRRLTTSVNFSSMRKPRKSVWEFVPSSNIWSLDILKSWLLYEGYGENIWYEKIYPQMKNILKHTTLASSHNSSHRENTFEFFGADFMIDQDLNIILLEINRSPDPASNTKYQRQMFDNLAEDALKVLYDFPRNNQSETGRFSKIL